MKTALFTSILFIFTFSVNAQQDLMLGGSFMGGVPFNSYAQNKNVLASKIMSANYGLGLSLQYRIFDRLGIEGGIMQNMHVLKFKDKNFEERNGGFSLKLRALNYYWSYYGALSYFQPLDDYVFLYGTLGYTINMIGKGERSITENFIVTNENVNVRTTYAPSNNSYFLELGIQNRVSDYTLIFAGLRFNKGEGQFLKGSYYTERDGSVLSSDQFSSVGTWFGLNLGLKVTLFHKDKRVRQAKPAVTPAPVAKPAPVQPEKKIDKKVAGRELKVSNKISVASGKVKILVWDDQEVDGDIVSINLNDQWILQNYTLEKKPKEIIVKLNPGENIIVLHAINLGRIKPNTAALAVDDGHKQQKLILTSDMNESGTLIIQW